MSLISSISGIRGTIGGGINDSLNAFNIVDFVSLYSHFLKHGKNKTIVIGRDGRKSGEMIFNLVSSVLISYGYNVIDLDIATTPTVEMEVKRHKAIGGIIITASHNPENWNALKFLTSKGEFLSEKQIKKMFAIKKEDLQFTTVEKIGNIKKEKEALSSHIKSIKKLRLVKTELIKKQNFKIIIDPINSAGAIALPELLKELGIKNLKIINQEIGFFSHNPEPIEKNLKQLKQEVVKNKADLGIAVDPDVDRLAFVDEKGNYFGEEYSLVAIADYVLQHIKGNTVSNLSSSQALKDITQTHGGRYYSSKVGEVNVVEKMRKTNAVIGGEGNGGIIYPPLHYGRDALVGIALFLSYLAQKKLSCSNLRKKYPSYSLLKEKIEINKQNQIDKILSKLEKDYKTCKINKTDGLKLIFSQEKEWIHIRPSNTEPILRIYIETPHLKRSQKVFKDIKEKIKKYE